MVSRAENELLVRTGPGTAMGDLLRRYWQPVGLSREIGPGKLPVSLTILGEDLVLFRDDSGRPGLLGRQCSHRRTDLSYGRVESGGLRCVYHGWLYDVDGNCIEQPGEARRSTLHERICHLSYPCRDISGLVFAYMGEGEPPLFPGYEFIDLPEENVFATKALHGCNYLQGNEGNVDPIHTSFLHRSATDRPELGGAVEGARDPLQTLLASDTVPKIELEHTDFGFRIHAIRTVGEGRYVRITSLVFPNGSAFSGATSGPVYGGYGFHWHVPITDETHWKFQIQFSRRAPLDHESFKEKYESPDMITPDYRFTRNPANRYIQDLEEQQTETYAGVGQYFHVHDALVVETMGAISDRENERLGSSDKAVIAYRRLLLKEVQELRAGIDPLHVVRDASKNRFVDLSESRMDNTAQLDHRRPSQPSPASS